jgi:hypothetical protein
VFSSVQNRPRHSAASLGSHLLEANRSERECSYNVAAQSHPNYAPQSHPNYAPQSHPKSLTTRSSVAPKGFFFGGPL